MSGVKIIPITTEYREGYDSIKWDKDSKVEKKVKSKKNLTK